MSRRSDRRGAFTILELCLTLLLVTIVATVSIWAWFSRAEITLVKAAQLLVEDLRLAQAQAAMMRQPVEVVFHADSGGYHIVARESDGVLPTAANPRAYSVDAVFEGVEILTRRMPANRLVFDERGRIGQDVSIMLVYRGESRTVVAQADGMVVLADGP